jgi:hypothetical protein
MRLDPSAVKEGGCSEVNRPPFHIKPPAVGRELFRLPRSRISGRTFAANRSGFTGHIVKSDLLLVVYPVVCG